METTQQDQDFGNSKNSSSSSYLCRQSSTRWTPTSDQIRILKELYYNNGIRSPTADQIQRIAARLRHYGKIEGKNVFYWFQNHKARERQKKRFTPAPVPPPPPPSTTVLPSPISDHHHHMHVQSNHIPYFYNHQQQQLRLHAAHHMISTPAEAGSSSSSSSQAFMPVGCGFGSLAMEKSFRECSISPGESKIPGNLGSWVGVDSYNCLEKNKIEISERHDHEEDPEDVDDDGGGELSGEIETLPLFPIHGGSTRHDIFKTTESVITPEHSNGGYYSRGNWFRSDGSRSSLELSLNSYGYYN